METMMTYKRGKCLICGLTNTYLYKMFTDTVCWGCLVWAGGQHAKHRSLLDMILDLRARQERRTHHPAKDDAPRVGKGHVVPPIDDPRAPLHHVSIGCC